MISPYAVPETTTHQSVWAILDVETTGFTPTRHRVIEIGISLRTHDFTEISRWDTLINPHLSHIDAGHIHGITPDMLTSAPTFADIYNELSHILNNHIALAHNARFDQGFINAEASRAEREHRIQAGPFLPHIGDTLSLARKILPSGPYNLPSLLTRFEVPCTHAHAALSDATATGDLLHTMLTTYGDEITHHFADTQPYHADHTPTLPVTGTPLTRSTTANVG